VPIHVVLDQNVPREVAPRLRALRPAWLVSHVAELGLSRALDSEIFAWAQDHGAIIITFDEDFADRRMFPVGTHCGVVRLHV